MIKFSCKNTEGFMSQHEVEYFHPFIEKAHTLLHQKTGPGNDYLGWVDLPVAYDKKEFARIKMAAEKIRNDSDVLIVIGIGGSYLGARAAIEALGHSFHNMLPKEKRNGPEIYFGRNHISSLPCELMELIEGKRFRSILSPSRTTRKPALLSDFQGVYGIKYGGDEARERIYGKHRQSRAR